jgi:thiol:disulfide interchange protein DsbD
VRWTLPEVSLKVVPGTAVASAAPPPAAKAEPAPPAKAEPAPASPAAAEPVKPAAEKGPRVVSEVEQKAQQGIIPLMIASALGGLLALVMPCVWPMVPITVNFFVKQGHSTKGGSTTGLAVTYCLAIIGVFTAVGVLCSFFLSATALPQLANNPWLNFAVAALFLAFGLSLLGLFEIRLPNALLNASARGESRGGLVGVVFMALTLTITSFTCTFPVVGGLLVMASTGQFFYPIIGLATFATVLALPFFLLALSPGLLARVPKSGDWMNAVKVVGGLVEIGAAFKFLNTAELAFVTPQNAWVDARVILTAWVILAAVCGFYLLGFFRTDHDHEEVRVGPGRMILGSAFLALALYLAPALFGIPPQGQIWNRLVVGLLPPDALNLARAEAGVGSGEKVAAREVHATSTDPKQAEREEKRFHGVWWGFSYEEAVEKAKAENKPILIDFTGLNCANCRLMEASVLSRPDVAEVLGRFIPVQLYTPPNVPIDSISREQRETLSERNAERQLDLTNEPTNPLYVILSPDEKVIGVRGGYNEPPVFLDFLNGSLTRMKGSGKVAQADAGR